MSGSWTERCTIDQCRKHIVNYKPNVKGAPPSWYGPRNGDSFFWEGELGGDER